MALRVHATTQAGRFRAGPLVVGAEWQDVDPRAPGMRQALLEHVGPRVRIHPLDVGGLADHQLELVGNRLVDRTNRPTTAGPPAASTDEQPAAAPGARRRART